MTDMTLSQLQQQFILHWGEMGSRWGVNRTVGQIHALLFVCERAMHAEEITETLGLARSNVSVSLKELQSYRLVRISHLLGDRRDHFEAIQDIWEIFRRVTEERCKREIDPTLSMLRMALLQTTHSPAEQGTLRKIRELHDFLELGTTWLGEMQRLSPETLMKVVKLGARIQHLIRGEVKRAD